MSFKFTWCKLFNKEVVWLISLYKLGTGIHPQPQDVVIQLDQKINCSLIQLFSNHRQKTFEQDRKMYPFIRSANAFLFSKFRPKLRLTETHISHFICWPWDIDMWGELNNGRALSLFDIGRYGLLARQGSVLEFYLKYKMSFTVATDRKFVVLRASRP